MVTDNITVSFPDKSPDTRLGELMLYIAGKCEQHQNFNATKLNKILYFADFLSYSRTGQAITGAEYVKQEHGPVPKRLLPIRKRLVERGEAAVKKVATVGGYEQHRLVPLREPDLSRFSGPEIDFVNKVILFFAGHNAKEVSEMSHNRIWRVAAMGQPIPYEAVFVSDENPTEEDNQRARKLIRQRGWVV
jgi:hypothetical protein